MKTQPNLIRVLGIAPTARGIGFAVLDGHEILVDWGSKVVNGDKNGQSLAKVAKLMKLYLPDIVALQDTSTKASRRSPRIKKLTQEIIVLAKKSDIKTVLLPFEEVRHAYFKEGLGTKPKLVEILVNRFAELAYSAPPKRRIGASEDFRMDIFDALALALCVRNGKIQNFEMRF